MNAHVIERLGWLARKLKTSKKQIVEDAIRCYIERMGLAEDENGDVFSATSGAWKRKESAPALIAKSRAAFDDSMHRKRPLEKK